MAAGTDMLIFYTAAGRMGEDRIGDMCGPYNHDGVFILGNRIRESLEDIAASHEHFMQRPAKFSAVH